MRWLVARRPIRQPRFGESPRDVLAWTVTPYIVVADERVLFASAGPFASLLLACAHARRECARHAQARARTVNG